MSAHELHMKVVLCSFGVDNPKEQALIDQIETLLLQTMSNERFDVDLFDQTAQTVRRWPCYSERYMETIEYLEAYKAR